MKTHARAGKVLSAGAYPAPNGEAQLEVVGKGEKVRQVLLPAEISARLLASHRDALASAPVFGSVRRPGKALTERVVNYLVKAAADRAGVNPAVSVHWHAHASHAIDCRWAHRRAVSHSLRLSNEHRRLDGAGRCIRALCFAPKGRGDVVLAQKLALELFEDEAIKVAHKVSGAYSSISFNTRPLGSRRERERMRRWR
jgi:hypothetical protein